MPLPNRLELRARAAALARSGNQVKQVKQTVYEVGISAGCLRNWNLRPVFTWQR